MWTSLFKERTFPLQRKLLSTPQRGKGKKKEGVFGHYESQVWKERKNVGCLNVPFHQRESAVDIRKLGGGERTTGTEKASHKVV